MESKSINLYYFGCNNRAAMIRASLEYGKIPFNDIKYGFEEWVKVKPTMEFGQLPALEVDGVFYVQSMATLVYVATQVGIMGTTPEEEYGVISLLCSFEDIYSKAHVFLYTGKTEEAKEESLNAFPAFITPILASYEKRAVKNGGKYMVGNSFSLADIYVSFIFNQIFAWKAREEALLPLFKEHAPTVYSIVQSVMANELNSFYTNGGWIKESPF